MKTSVLAVSVFEQPLDEPLKRALLERGAAFEALIDAAKDWEKQTDQSL